MNHRKAVIESIECYLRNYPGKCRLLLVDEQDNELASYAILPHANCRIRDQCKIDILLTLRECGHRIVGEDLMTALEEKGRIHGVSAVKRKLPDMIDDGWIDNDQKTKPKGYTLTELGEAILDGKEPEGES